MARARANEDRNGVMLKRNSPGHVQIGQTLNRAGPFNSQIGARSGKDMNRSGTKSGSSEQRRVAKDMNDHGMKPQK